MCFAQPNFPGKPGVFDGGQRRRAGAATVAADGDDVGARFGDAGGDDADSGTGYEFDADTCLGIYGAQIVDQLRQVFNAVDVVMGRRRDERRAGRGMANARDVLGDFLGGQLAAFTGFGALRHLDFQLFGVDEIVRGDAETPGSNLFNFVGGSRLVAIGVGVFSTFTGVAFAAEDVHGGGWVLGDYPTHKRMVRDLVVLSGFAGVFVNYTRTPDAQYPQAINEIYAATKWVAEHGEEIGVDGKNLAVVGNSVGGNMTAVIALMAKAKGGPAIKCQVMFWPVTDANFETESYNEYDEGYFLTKSMMKWFSDAYATDAKQRKEIYASPLQATIEQLKGLPPAMVQTAGNDVLRDEGEAYARKLDEAGVDVTAVRYEGLIHDYGLLNGLSEVPAVRDALHQAAEMLKKHLK